MPNTADLLDEIAALKAMLIAADARDLRKDARIERLEKLVAAFKHAVFGRKSEKIDPDQFELALEAKPAPAAAVCIVLAKMSRRGWTSSPPSSA